MADLRTDYVGTEDTEEIDHAGMHNEVNAAANLLRADVDDLATDVTTLTTRADDVDSALDGIDATLAGLATDKADDSAVVHLTGDEAIDGTKTFLDAPVSVTPATSANHLVTKAVMDAAISAGINALVAGAPGALDTLLEIAAAFGNDPNYAASVTSALAAKADKAANLSDLANIATARTNLGLGNAATRNVGTTTGTVAAGDDSRLSDTRTPTDNTVATAKVVDRAITFAKVQAIGTSRLLGRTTASSGDVEELTAAQVTALVGGTSSSTLAVGDHTHSGGGYATVKDEGSSLTQRATVDFIGAGVAASDDSSNSKTKVYIPGAYPSHIGSGFLWALAPLQFGSIANFGTYQREYIWKVVVPDSMAATAGWQYAQVLVDTANASGTVRVGVYNDNAGVPFTRAFDWGTVSAAATGLATLTLPAAWKPTAGTYWLSVTIQGNSAVKLRGAYPALAEQPLSGSIPAVGVYYRDGVSGGIASSATSALGNIGDSGPSLNLQ